MQARTLLQRTALVAAVAVVPATIAGAAQAAGGHVATECATVKVRATPQLNTAMIPETITSKVTSCATANETVKLVQHISGPSAAASVPMDKTWTITLSPGQTVKKVRSFPYSCCGSYTVTDTVKTTSGQKLAKGSSNFTFA